MGELDGHHRDQPQGLLVSSIAAGEFRVDTAYSTSMEAGGGNGIIPLCKANGVWTGSRDIKLERHPT